MEQEILERRCLLTEKARLTRPGWSRSDIFDYNKELLRGSSRLAEWEFYQLFNDSFALQIVYGHAGSMGRAGASLIDFGIGQRTEFGSVALHPGDALDLDFSPETPHNLKAENGENFLSVDFDGISRRIILRSKRFDAELCVHDEGDAMAAAHSFDSPRCFFYGYDKCFTDLAGHIQFRNQDYEMDTSTFLTLHSGRGRWPGRSEWVRCTGAQEYNGHTYALILNWGVGNNAVPGALFEDGRLQPLGQIRSRGSDRDSGKVWQLSDDSGRLHLKFTPDYDNHETFKRLSCGRDAHQLYGRASGSVITEDNEKIPLDMCFFIEHAQNRW